MTGVDVVWAVVILAGLVLWERWPRIKHWNRERRIARGHRLAVKEFLARENALRYGRRK